jgi:protoheme IX farnesyltransferase
METISEISDLPASELAISAAPWRAKLADFYELTKPRMNFLVVVTTMVGYYMAARGWGDWARVVYTLVGTALTAAGSSILNQYAERDLDLLMRRTARRPLPGGRVRPADALLYGVVLSVAGMAVLAFFVNPLTALLGAITLVLYVFVYTPAKRRTTICTLIGAVPGAIPPMMGFTAVQGTISLEAFALFAILFFWQMPHFLAIAILYRDDYARGGFQMLPVVDPELHVTGRQIVLYSLSLIPVTLLPALIGMAGVVYFAAALLLGLAFTGFGIVCARSKCRSDARQLFLASIVYLPALLAAMMLDKI